VSKVPLMDEVQMSNTALFCS